MRKMSANTRTTLTVAVLFAGMISMAGPSSLRAASEDPDWPCVQRLVPEISIATVWAGPPVEDALQNWQRNDAVQALVGRISLRRTPIEEAEKAIEDFASPLGADKDAQLTLVFAGLFETISQQRRQLINGIKKYAKRQRKLAAKIRDMTAELERIPVGGAPENVARRRELEEKWTWDQRIFDEREHSLLALCEQPVLLDQRLYVLSRAIMTQMDG